MLLYLHFIIKELQVPIGFFNNTRNIKYHFISFHFPNHSIPRYFFSLCLTNPIINVKFYQNESNMHKTKISWSGNYVFHIGLTMLYNGKTKSWNIILKKRKWDEHKEDTIPYMNSKYILFYSKNSKINQEIFI